jgi:uncharacterized protein
MKVVIAGGSGFLGRPLAAAFTADGHNVVVLSRTAKAAPAPARGLRTVPWTPNGDTGPWAGELDGAAAVVNLAGESIAARRWSDAHKKRILDSRVQATRSLAAAIRASSAPPAVVISGSAVGYYGPCGDEVVTEESRAGNDFLAHVCKQWEAEAQKAASDRTRVVCIRTGIAVERDGGALPPMLPPFWFGVGGPMGSGRQYWPWIHRADWIALVRWAVDTPAAAGPINATGPTPVTNREFVRALGRAMHRPAFMPAPGFALRLLLGEMADALILSGQRAVPAKAERLGFSFRYRNVTDALAAIFTGKTG